MLADYHTLEDLQVWARSRMQRVPDFIIGDDPDQPYMKRWWIVPRNEGCNVYLHEILRSDDDRALHDHPWVNTSYLIEGSYFEITPEGGFQRGPGDIIERPATALHRLIVPEGMRCISLFMTGPKIREWGFACPKGWVHWKEFTDPENAGGIGRGCE